MREVVNDHNSLRISARIPRTWRILLFRSTTIEIDSGLYFLFHNFGVQIMPFKTKKLSKNLSEGKKKSQKRTQSLLPREVNSDPENNDLRNVLSRHRSKLRDFSINDIRQCSICSRLYLSGVF